MAVSLLWEVSAPEVELDPVAAWPPAAASAHEEVKPPAVAPREPRAPLPALVEPAPPLEQERL